MNKVTILPPDVIAKIAAGEVVDRPASVVKELVENSLDAGATAIEVHLKDAGKELIHIKDNGCGIARGDLENLFNRHATSKIQNIDDLERLASMGFRGEALYSIAAISDITLRTQTIDGSEAWSIHMRGGSRMNLEPSAPSGHGTDIKIAELFFNTPARRKFLKSNTSETNAIINVVLPYALIYPNKRFVLTHATAQAGQAGRTILDLYPAGSRKDRIATALNLEQDDLLETSQDYPLEKIFIKLVLGNINIQRPRRDLQYIFINGRPVDSKSLSFAMNDIYRLVFPPGIYPSFVLDVRLDPANVDVNIHPTKREVKIKNEAKLCSILRRLTEYTLMQFGNARSVDAPSQVTTATAGQASHTTQAIEQGLPANDIVFAPGQLQSSFNPARYSSYEQTKASYQTAPIAESLNLPDLFNAPDENLNTKLTRARFIGQFINKFLLFEEGTSLYLVDQHAAQERIMFEKFSKQITDGTIEIQPLLTPLLIKLTPQERLAWDEIQENLKDVGIEATLFDEETLAVQTQPILLKNIENAVRTLLSGDDVARCDRNTLARRACKASIVTGDRLSAPQADYQRQQLLACQDPFTCPHGRPTVIELKETFLDKQFLRT